jgi:hypothetical protein
MLGQGVNRYKTGKMEEERTQAGFAREQAKQQQLAETRKKGQRIFESGTPSEISAFIAENPEVAKDVTAAYNFKNDLTKANKIETLEKILIDGVDPVEANIERAEIVDKEGGEYQETLGNIQTGMQDKQALLKKAEREYALLAPKEKWDAYLKTKDEKEDGKLKVGAQEILEDGTIVQSTDKGPVVYNPEGRKVKGKAAADAVAQARAREISNARKRAGEKKTATLEAEEELKGKVEAGVISQKEAAKISAKAFDRLEKINMNLRNLQEGIGLLRVEGANTGVVDKYLPSLRKATIKMDNLQGRLGLDVLNTTTFGALSAGELKFALDTAVPKGLQPKDLANWLEEKRSTRKTR